MTDLRGQDPPDQRVLASAFAGRVSAARASGGAKLLAALMVAALAGGVVFGVGYLTRPAKKHPATASAPGRSPAVTMSPPAASSPPTARTTATRDNSSTQFTAVVGYGCPPLVNARFTEYGRWTDGLSGFISVRADGPYASGCDGAFDAMPMSGSKAYDDPSNYALWTFRTGPLRKGTCDISVYIPADRSVEHVGGNPAVYQVFGSANTEGPDLGTFGIDQLARRGGWVSEPGWPITTGWLTVKLDSYGIDWSANSMTYAHIAVSAIRLTCVP